MFFCNLEVQNVFGQYRRDLYYLINVNDEYKNLHTIFNVFYSKKYEVSHFIINVT
jgi:hypothetical protein